MLNYNEDLLEIMVPYFRALNSQYEKCSETDEFGIEEWTDCLKFFAKSAVEDGLENFDFDEYNDTFEECLCRVNVKLWILDHFDEITEICAQVFDNKNIDQNEKENQQFLIELGKFCKNNMDSSLLNTVGEHPNLVIDLYFYLLNFFENNDEIKEKFDAEFDNLNKLYSKSYENNFNDNNWENALLNFATRNDLLDQYDYEIFDSIFTRLIKEKKKIDDIESSITGLCEAVVDENINTILILQFKEHIDKNSTCLENNYNQIVENLNKKLIANCEDENLKKSYLKKFQIKIEKIEDIFNEKYRKLLVDNSFSNDDKRLLEEKGWQFFDKVQEAKEGGVFNSNKWKTISNEICSDYLTQNYNSTFLLNEILEEKKKKIASSNNIKPILKENINKIFVPYKIDNTHFRRIVNIIKSDEVRKKILGISKESFDKSFCEVVEELTNEFTEAQLKQLKDEIQTSIEGLSHNFEKCFYSDEYHVKKFDADKWKEHVQYFQDNMLEDDYNQFIITKVFLEVYLG